MNRPYDPSYQYDPEVRSSQLLMNIKQRAKRKGMKFDLTLEWLLERLRNGVCEKTGMPLEIKPQSDRNKGVASPWAPSVDRFDNNKGYTQDNCYVTTWMYNVAKNKFTHDELVKFCRGVLIAEALRKENT